MGVQAVFVVLLMFAATVESGIGDVSFWGDVVTLTCPGTGTWKGTMGDRNESETHEFQFKGQAQYICEYNSIDEQYDSSRIDKIKYMFYVKGKACKNCYEVDGFLFMLVILVDVIGTAALMRIIYVCTKKKHPDIPIQPQRTRRPRPRPDQSSDYESLNPNTQSTETYSTVVHRTG